MIFNHNPTAHAYERVCEVLNKTREEKDVQSATIAQLDNALSESKAKLLEAEANLRAVVGELRKSHTSILSTQLANRRLREALESIEKIGDKCRCDIGYAGGCGCGERSRDIAHEALSDPSDEQLIERVAEAARIIVDMSNDPGTSLTAVKGMAKRIIADLKGAAND